jgi:hypothetical protein
LCCGVEETKTLETLHDPSGVHPVRKPKTSVSCGIEETNTLGTSHDSGKIQREHSHMTSVFAINQSVNLAKVSLAKLSIWQNCHSGQIDVLAKIIWQK